jgi:hypothetical protein
MNRKFLPWGIAIGVFALNALGVRGQSYEFAVVSNGVAGVSFNAVANDGTNFVCVGASKVVSINTNGFAAFAGRNFGGGYLLDSSTWAISKTNFSMNCVAAQPSGFIGSGTSNAVFTSFDGFNWTKSGNVVPGSPVYVVGGIAYNQVSKTYAAALEIYEAYHSTNPPGVWQPGGLPGQSFAESFRAVTAFGPSSNMVLCGILGDIRTSFDGGSNWVQSQPANLNYPPLLAVASDWPNGKNPVCVGDNSLIEVSTNGGQTGSWAFQSKFDIKGAPGGSTNFDSVTYSSATSNFLAAGAVGAYGLIAMASEVTNGGNLIWTRQTNNLWSAANGTLTQTNINILSGRTISGASFANSNLFQGVAMLVGNNGTIIVGGVPPPAPSGMIDSTNCALDGQFGMCANQFVGVIVNGNSADPTNDIAIDWSTNAADWANASIVSTNMIVPANGFTATNGGFLASFVPTNESPGTYPYYARARDLRTGFFSAIVTNIFKVNALPFAPEPANQVLTNTETGPYQTNSPLVVDVNNSTNLINTDSHGVASVVADWYTADVNQDSRLDAQGLGLVAIGGATNYDGSSGWNLLTATNTLVFNPTNLTCGSYTYYARARVFNPSITCECQSTNLTPVTLVIIPAAPISLGNETNCAGNGMYGMCPNSPLSVTVLNPAGQTNEVNWYDGNSNLVAAGTLAPGGVATFTPTNSSPGVYTYFAQATNLPTGLVSTWTQLTFQVNALPQWTNTAEFYTNTLTSPNQINPTMMIIPYVNNLPPGDQILVDWYTNSDPTVATYNAPTPPFAYGGLGTGAGTFGSFNPTNRTCGIYTYYARARVVDPSITTGCWCQSSNLVPVTFVLLPLAPTDAVMNLTNALTGATQTNTPIWVDVFTNADNPFSSFAVNWYTSSNGVNNVNDNTETNLSNRFFHTPTNATCGVFTYFAETVAGGSLLSTNRTPVTFAIIPGAPTSLGNETNCAGNGQFGMCSNAPLIVTVTIPVGQTNEVNWYDENSNLVVAGTLAPGGIATFTPTNSSPGVYTYFAQATNLPTGFVSTWTQITFQVNALPQWTNNMVEVYTNTIASPNPAMIVPLGITNLASGQIAFVDWYTNSDPAVASINFSNPPIAWGTTTGFSTLGALTPTNRNFGIYTYYARARVYDPTINSGCWCQSSNLITVTFVLLPPAPTDAIMNWTNALIGANQTNAPIYVDLFTNTDNPFSSFMVNWYTTSNSVNNVNDNTETNSSNRFFHTPTNATCGVFTYWAETVASNSASGTTLASTNRLPVVFTIVPATPTALTALGAFDQTNCIEVPNPTFTVTVTNGQTAEWFSVPSSGTTVTNLSFTPTNSSPGTWTFSAQALDTNSELTSTGSVFATLTLSNCSSPLTININSGSVTGSIQWPGNLVLLSTTNITPPVHWTIVSTGSMFLAPNSFTFTNTNPPIQFFRLTN